MSQNVSAVKESIICSDTDEKEEYLIGYIEYTIEHFGINEKNESIPVYYQVRNCPK